MSDMLSLMPGTVIHSHYIVRGLLNSGGFGSVYRGIDTSEGSRSCAIKETYDVTPAARRQALTEVAVLFTINSAHLPQVYDAFEDEGRFYLVMQLIEGQNLLELSNFRGRPFGEEEVLRWLLPVIEVLQELHSRIPAVIHRDIKPGNIILTHDEQAVLVDFGLTKLYDPSNNSHTMVRAVSEGFSSIEHYIGRTTPQSDIYSMAATMYFLLTHTVPPVAIERSFQDELVAPRLLNAQISPNTEAALLKALAVNADQRFASMYEFARALQQPSFMLYNAPSFADDRFQAASAPTERVALPSPPPPSFIYTPAPPLYGMQPQSQPIRSRSAIHSRPTPTPSGQVMRPPMGRAANVPSYPILPPRPIVTTPPYAPRPQSYKALPGPYNQGCLWGMLQGICAALIVLNTQNNAYLYVAVAEGFFFYFVAGFLTTRKGGSSLRGMWAGFWSGIFSTIIFWVVLLVGLVIEVARRVQLNLNNAKQLGRPFDFNTALSQAFHQVAPLLTNQQNSQQSGQSLIVFLVVGLFVAMMFGLIGGVLGSMWARRRSAAYRT